MLREALGLDCPVVFVESIGQSDPTEFVDVSTARARIACFKIMQISKINEKD
jgi:hypothetical protein